MRKAVKFILWILAALVSLPAVLVLILALFSNQQSVVPPTGKALNVLAIQGVHVVDTESGALLKDQTLLVSDGTVTAVGESPSIPPGTHVIAGEGRYVLPGLWNMHTHVSNFYPGFRLESMPAMVAHGVMYARNLNSDCFGAMCVFAQSVDEMRALGNQVVEGVMLGPRLVGLGSYAVNGPPEMGAFMQDQPAYLAPTTAEQGRELARYLQQRGVDFIKPYSAINRAAYFGMMEEAVRLGLEVGGHLPQGVFLLEAIEAGQRSIEHAVQLPLACSPVEAEFRPAFERYVDLTQLQRDAFKTERPEDYDYVDSVKDHYRDIIERYDEAGCKALLAEWAAADSYYVPTHLTRWAETVMHQFPWEDDPRAAFVGDIALMLAWASNGRSYIKRFGERPEQEQAFIDYVTLGQQLTGLAHAAGVKLMVGTDVGDTLIYPGASFHDEMHMMVEGGMPAAAVLRAATVTAAEYEGMDDRHGSIAPGKAANLVLLVKNPLENIGNSSSVDAIYYQGRYYNRDELDVVMAGVESRAKGFNHFLRNGWDVVRTAFQFLLM
ncbi:MAG: amidohydrolase family protein [Pseudomonadota bacterium]